MKNLTDSDDRLPDDIFNSKNVLMLTTCLIKDDSKLHRQIWLKALLVV